jgi:P pilus assembly chaperone PapD
VFLFQNKLMKTIRAIATLAFLLSLVFHLHAQISLAPSFVFIDENSGVGNLYVSNNGEQPQEVTISFQFGYPGSDADGNLVMVYDDEAAAAQYSLDEMIRAFPRSFILPAGEQRTVRLQVVPAERRKEGFYYSRMKVLAKPQTPDITQESAQGIATRISFNFEQVTAVFYKRGKVSTGLVVKELDVRQNEKMLELRPHLQRTGNAPYLGSMIARLKDDRGNVVAETQSTTTAYFDVIRRMDLDLAEVVPGVHTLELSFETRRNDMMAGNLVQAPTIVHTARVTVK